MRPVVSLLLSLAACAAHAQATPQEVYAEFHRAWMREDYEAMALLSTNSQQRLERARTEKKPAIKAAMAVSPDYQVTSRRIDGNRASLRLVGSGGTLRPDTEMVGEVELQREEGGWKVHSMTWRARTDADVVAAMPTRPQPVSQLDNPEAVYAQYHRALMAGDVATMGRLSTEEHHRKAFASDQEKARARHAGQVLSPTYTITGRAAGPTRTVLTARGASGPAFGGGPLDGRIVLVKQGDEWRVDNIAWTPASAAQSSAPRTLDAPRALPPGVPELRRHEGPPPPAVSVGRGAAVGNAAPAR